MKPTGDGGRQTAHAMPWIMVVLLTLMVAGPASGSAGKWDEAKEMATGSQVYHLILDEGFDAGLGNWVFEGDAEIASVAVEDGKGVFRTKRNDASVGAMWWYKDDLPADFRAEWTITPQAPGFFMTFFAVRGVDGKDILSAGHKNVEEKEWGKYFQKYVHGEIDGYHISYDRGKNRDCNLRKNTGLILLKNQKEGPHLLEMGRPYRVVLTKRGGLIHLAVDGKTFMDYEEDGETHGSVHTSGKFGFRQVYGSEATYDDIRIYDLQTYDPGNDSQGEGR